MLEEDSLIRTACRVREQQQQQQEEYARICWQQLRDVDQTRVGGEDDATADFAAHVLPDTSSDAAVLGV